MVRALAGSYDLFRPSKASGYDGAMTYTKVTIFNAKLSQPSHGWTIDTAGSMRTETATLYYNPNHSSMSSVLDPLFKTGDIICKASDATEPSAERLTVQSITEHTARGSLHHYEVVLT